MPTEDEHEEVEQLKQSMVKFKKSYSDWKQPADDFRKQLEAMLSQLMKQNAIVPAVLESRVKSEKSSVRNVDGLPIDNVMDLEDFIGLRLVFLLTDEVAKAVKFICETFVIVKRKDMGNKLKFNEFGYRAIHLIAGLPRDWQNNPIYAGCGHFKFEIQLRTLSQHNYGVASRVFQYRQPEAVPPSVQRSLLRLAAILELVDLEIERVSREKLAYSANAMKILNSAELLNVDLIIQILGRELPQEHRVLDDRYPELFDELTRKGINTAGQLLDLIKEFGQAAMEINKKAADEVLNKNPAYTGDLGKAQRGVYYTQVGLVWNMLEVKNRLPGSADVS
jgi:ppGpp synthetase/RelA/SpoT-type nucleotidyltranferase